MAPLPRSNQTNILAAVAGPLGCIVGGVGVGLLIIVLVLGWLLFDVAPHALDSIARTFGS
ncbi:hypothetical protein IAD21_05033 [Abditibacteriota bacterium]|nr:hypothetical protein IAD21_05033 [Abditibacteriota bacterium]